MTRKHNAVWEDPFDSIDELEEGYDGGFVIDSGVSFTEVVFCDYGMGDSDSLCIKARYGCCYIGCDVSDEG